MTIPDEWALADEIWCSPEVVKIWDHCHWGLDPFILRSHTVVSNGIDAVDPKKWTNLTYAMPNIIPIEDDYKDLQTIHQPNHNKPH